MKITRKEIILIQSISLMGDLPGSMTASPL